MSATTNKEKKAKEPKAKEAKPKAKVKAKPKAASAAARSSSSTSGKSLVIVESPTKEKTLSRFLGKEFMVKSSFGHLRDLPKKTFGLDVDDHFKPQYEMLPHAKKILPDLRAAVKDCANVYLATDYDREGEAIAWHLSEMLNAPEDRVHRITFHEITPEAIREAIKTPRKIDQSLVDAQVARRVLDRIVGYRLSPLLWEKIKRGLSAGRVQSVAVRLICEREEEVERFKSQEYWTIQVELENTKEKIRFPFLAHLSEWNGKKIQKLDIHSKDEASGMAEKLTLCDYLVKTVVAKEKKRSPLPPFMTSTLAQDASRKLGFSAQRTMRIAQGLYEGVEINKETIGLITYMRTDSLNIASTAQKEAVTFIEKRFGKDAVPEKPRVYKTKSKGAQEAHEAIRPTSAFRDPDSIKDALNQDQLKLYTLIWKRFLASQMTDAHYDTVSVEIEAKTGGDAALLRAFGSTLKDPGFLRVYEDDAETDEPVDNEAAPNKLPVLHPEEALKYLKVNPEQHFTEPPPRYNEASLIKALEQNGIGRPSTYAPIIDTILSRGYVRLQEKRFYPTELGQVVDKQLVAHFPEIVDTQFTAKIEAKLDQIAEGDLRWHLVIDEFYQPFDKDLKAASTAMQKITIVPKDSGELCQLDQGKLLIRESRFGKYLCCEHFPKCRYKVSLDANGQKIVPQSTDEKCQKCGKPMVVKMGRRGKFLACSGYPDCKNIIGLDREGNKVFRPPPEVTDRKCEKCSKPFFLRVGKRGPFLACSGFPRCRNIKKAENYNIVPKAEEGPKA